MSLDTGVANELCARRFVNSLAACGLRHVCISPGSRSTPLALAFARHPDVRVWIGLDERSSSFFAVGMAKASGEAVAVLCTSGTAAANFHPAVVEALYDRAPLLVLTADRPPELQGIGSPQTIDQSAMYGSHVKWFEQMPVPEGSTDLTRFFEGAARRAITLAASVPAGPVHLNFPFREPLVSTAGGSAPDTSREFPAHTPASRVMPRPEIEAIETVAQLARHAQCGLIVCGPLRDPKAAMEVTRLQDALGWPMLADPLSQLRSIGLESCRVIDRYDALLRLRGFAQECIPDMVLRLGAPPVSKSLHQALGAWTDAHQIVVTEDPMEWQDPALSGTERVFCDTGEFAMLLRKKLENSACSELDTGWSQRWHDANERTERVTERFVSRCQEMFEGRVFSELRSLLPDGALLYIGNSMPVRDLDTFFGNTAGSVRVLGNRGASGIDGVTSSALGAAALHGTKAVLVVGDLSFYHDMNGLLAAARYDLNLVVVLINNDGGGIFSFLPQASDADHFELLFGTPHGIDFAHAAAMYGATYARPENWQSFRHDLARGLELGGLHIVEVRSNRDRNVELHRQLWNEIAAELETSIG